MTSAYHIFVAYYCYFTFDSLYISITNANWNLFALHPVRILWFPIVCMNVINDPKRYLKCSYFNFAIWQFWVITFAYSQAAESGNLETFKRLYFAEPTRLAIQDIRGRTATHQAAARNRKNILEFIVAQGGGKYYFYRFVSMNI